MIARRSQWLIALLVGALALWLLGPAISGRQSFVFRDAAHYFAPLFEWNRDAWLAGRAPLWNPLEYLGLPQLAENTASVCYPGQVLLLAPIEFLWAYNLYIVAHVLLAALGAWRLARRFGGSIEAAGYAALAYAFAGPVVFQYCNVVFLVGAAWAPLALEAVDRVFAGATGANVSWLAVCLAMMVLGGDPQMAYHVALAAMLYAIVLLRAAGDDPAQAARRGLARRDLARRAGWLSVAACLALLLAAIQILPTWELARLSPRAHADRPRSVWEVIAWSLCVKGPQEASRAREADKTNSRRGNSAGQLPSEPTSPTGSPLWDARHGGRHLQQAYDYSIGPWRWPELLWPNFAGRQFPIHRRWLSSLEPGAGLWAPSLYAGALTLPLAWLGRRRRSAAGRWMTWLAIGSALASLGQFGLGLALDWLAWATWRSAQLGCGPEVGGVYWLMNVLLPGYVAFRYPAKLWTLTALALAMLAARGWDAIAAGNHRSAARVLLWLAPGGAAVGALVGGVALMRALALPTSDEFFGPLDRAGAVIDLLAALAQSAVVLLAGAWLWTLHARKPALASIALLALAALDLGVAHRWLFPCVPTSAWRTKPALASEMRAASNDAPSPPRFFRRGDWPLEAWLRSSSAERLDEIFARDRATLYPKYHLPLGLANVDSSGMLAPDDYFAFWEVAQEEATKPALDERAPHTTALDLVGAKYLVWGRDSNASPSGNDWPTLATERDVELRRNPNDCPRAWIVHEVERLAPLENQRPATLRKRTREILFPTGRLRDWRREAVVETERGADEIMPRDTSSGPAAAGAAEEFCRVVDYQPDHVAIEARLARPGLVILRDYWYAGWRAGARPIEGGIPGEAARWNGPLELEILRTDRLLRGVALPAGAYRVEFDYRPLSVRAGLAVSGAAWLGLAGFAVWRRRIAAQRRRASGDRTFGDQTANA